MIDCADRDVLPILSLTKSSKVSRLGLIEGSPRKSYDKLPLIEQDPEHPAWLRQMRAGETARNMIACVMRSPIGLCLGSAIKRPSMRAFVKLCVDMIKINVNLIIELKYYWRQGHEGCSMEFNHI